MRFIRFIPLAAIALSATVAGAQKPARHKKVEKVETQADLQKEAKISMDDARAIALREVPNATVQSGEIEREGGLLIYSFDMKVAGRTAIDEVNIDAKTGKLISHEREMPEDERAEAAADARDSVATAKSAKRAKHPKHPKHPKRATPTEAKPK